MVTFKRYISLLGEENNAPGIKAQEYNKKFGGMFLRTIPVGTPHKNINLPEPVKQRFYGAFGKKPFYKSASNPLKLDLQTYKSGNNPKVCVSTVRSQSLAWTDGSEDVVVLMGFAPFEKLYDKDIRSSHDAFSKSGERTGPEDEDEKPELFSSNIEGHDEGWVNYTKAQIVAGAVPDELYRDQETRSILKQYNPDITIITKGMFNKLFQSDKIISFLYNERG